MYRGYQGEKLHKLKKKLIFLYDLKKQSFFHILMFFFSITPKIRATDKNELQIRILHRKIHQLKEKKNILFYMTLNDNNTFTNNILILFIEKMSQVKYLH